MPLLKSRSEKIFSQLCEVIPGGVNSPVRSCKGMGQGPMVVVSGCKDIIVDADGNEFIDYCGSWGALIHGHCAPQIIEAAQKRMALGTSFGITTEIEEKLARKVVEMIPSIEKIRFVSSGTEATMSAVRLARGFTGRKTVIKFVGNYHGHADFFLVQAGSGVTGISPTSSSAGIPNESVQHMISLPFNDKEIFKNYFEAHGNEIACVIIEAVAGNMGVVPAQPEFIKMLEEMTKKTGALLIFDEVMTGFRVAKKGAQSIYNVSPDLTCFGKIIGGGFPAAAFGGSAEIMDFLAPLGPVYQAGTLSGNPVAMEAGYQSLCLLDTDSFYEELERKTKIITDAVVDFIKQKNIAVAVQQVGSMFTIFFGRQCVSNMDEAKSCDLERFADFFRYMYANGVYIPPSQFEAWFVSTAHEECNLIRTKDLIIKYLQNL